jgi:predicted MFS family arabinose efflux permease
MENPRLTLFVLQMVNFAGSSGYAILIPLYPPLAKSKGISDATIGYIFCLYPVGGLLVSILLGSVMTV